MSAPKTDDHGTSDSNQDHKTRPIQTIGYIGLGNAGFSMSSNLPKHGYQLVVYDQDMSKVARAVSEWNHTVSGADESGKAESSAFRDCDLVITMLPHGEIVRSVLLGEGGIAPSLKAGTIIVDTSSSSPAHTRSLGKELDGIPDRRLRLVDSPITQTYMHATDDGKATLMVGCDDDDVFRRIRPVLTCMASHVFHMGRLGTGHAMKTFNNYIMASSIVALADSLVVGQKHFDLNPQTMIDVLNVGTGVNFPTLDTFRRDALTRRFDSGFGLALLVKDLAIAADVMHDAGFETDLPPLLSKYLSHAMHVIGDHRNKLADHTECIRGWEQRAGVEINKTDKVRDIPPEDFEHRCNGLNRE